MAASFRLLSIAERMPLNEWEASSIPTITCAVCRRRCWEGRVRYAGEASGLPEDLVRKLSDEGVDRLARHLRVWLIGMSEAR
jgi:hypothetical protein